MVGNLFIIICVCFVTEYFLATLFTFALELRPTLLGYQKLIFLLAVNNVISVLVGYFRILNLGE